ncbi:MAG: hypothetical protein ACU826_03675 [Gammaproteobacteria bacterium]
MFFKCLWKVNIYISILLFVVGCTYTVSIDAPIDKPPLIDPLPIVIGIYYPPEFRDYEHRQIIPGVFSKNTWVFKLGPASITLFEKSFSSLFRKTVILENLTSLPSNESDINAIIVPNIERFHLTVPIPPGISEFPVPFSTYSASIDYRITLLSPNRNDVIASWIVSGDAVIQHTYVSDGFPFTFWVKALYREVTMKAMREAMAQLISGFYEQTEIRKWLINNSYESVR